MNRRSWRGSSETLETPWMSCIDPTWTAYQIENTPMVVSNQRSSVNTKLCCPSELPRANCRGRIAKGELPRVAMVARDADSVAAGDRADPIRRGTAERGEDAGSSFSYRDSGASIAANICLRFGRPSARSRKFSEDSTARKCSSIHSLARSASPCSMRSRRAP